MTVSIVSLSGKNARVKYVEKHYGEGDGNGKRILNPVTEVYMEENSYVEMEMVQIKGVDSTNRMSTAELAAGAKMIVRERLLTHGSQNAESTYIVNLNGEGASAEMWYPVPLQRIHRFRLLIPKLWEMPSAAVIRSATPLSWMTQRSLPFQA